MSEQDSKSLVDQEWEKNPRAMYDAHREIWREMIAELTAELQAAQATIAEIAESVNVFRDDEMRLVIGEVVEAVRSADTSAYDAAILDAKAGVLRESSRLLDGAFYHVGEGEVPFHPGQEYEGHMMQAHVQGMLQRWFEARAVSIEQKEERP